MMSVHLNVRTPSKKNLAQVLRAFAGMIEDSSNQTVTVCLDVTFNPREKEAEKNES